MPIKFLGCVPPQATYNLVGICSIVSTLLGLCILPLNSILVLGVGVPLFICSGIPSIFYLKARNEPGHYDTKKKFANTYRYCSIFYGFFAAVWIFVNLMIRESDRVFLAVIALPTAGLNILLTWYLFKCMMVYVETPEPGHRQLNWQQSTDYHVHYP